MKGVGARTTKLLPCESLQTFPEKLKEVSRRVGSMSAPSAVGTMEIKLSKGTLRMAGTIDVVALRAVLECLAGWSGYPQERGSGSPPA